MLKGKKYDWTNSNMAFFRPNRMKRVKKAPAEPEPAWQGCGQEVGLKIWRIVKSEVTEWPQEDYGKFYECDSYIVLNTYQEDDSEELSHEVHFWIGKYSTQDEYVTAAYKTDALDTFLGNKPILHREVQGHESSIFRNYFKEIRYMKGSADTGFNRVPPEQYTPRLLKVSRGDDKVIVVSEIARKKDNVTSDDVVILDLGLELYQWNGSSVSQFEKNKAAKVLQTIVSERSGCATSTVLDEADISPNHKFYESLNDEDDDDDIDVEDEEDLALFKVSEAYGIPSLHLIDDDNISRESLSSDNVYIIDTRIALFLWIGDDVPIEERRYAFDYTHQYLKQGIHPWLPVTVVSEGQETKCQAFMSVIPGCA